MRPEGKKNVALFGLALFMSLPIIGDRCFFVAAFVEHVSTHYICNTDSCISAFRALPTCLRLDRGEQAQKFFTFEFSRSVYKGNWLQRQRSTSQEGMQAV